MEPAAAPLYAQIRGMEYVRRKAANVPMETISNRAVKMDGYELRNYKRGATIVKRIGTHDEGDGHPKPLENISQGPDCKRV